MHLRTPLIAAVAAALLIAAPSASAAEAPAGGAVFGPLEPVGIEADVGAILGDAIEVRGTVEAAAGSAVRVERRGERGSKWRRIARTRADADGSFVVEWESDALGRHALRAMPADEARVRSAAADAPIARTTVFRPARATWYGPGFWGRRTACGRRLRRSTLGVAHRRLPCGTRVTIFHDGETIEVPVIDRGPFTDHASWDLTRAAARRIGMTATSRIGWARAER